VSRSADPGTVAIITGAWIGLIAWLFWQELRIETWSTGFWFRLPATILFSFVILLFALETMFGEMTVRRWAGSVAVFGGFGILFLIGGIFEPAWMHLSRWLMLPAALFYFLAAGIAAAQARDA
jgi:hypothetical protein